MRSLSDRLGFTNNNNNNISNLRDTTMRGWEVEEHHHHRVLSDLSSMVTRVLKSHPLPFLAHHSATATSYLSCDWWSQQPLLAWASMFLGMSLTLMLFGSITFIIGLLLMPWVFGLAILFSFTQIVSALSQSILYHSSSSSSYFPED